MQATLLGILGLALLGTLHAQDSIPVQADFQQDKFTGRWYSIGLASNSHWFKEKRHLMKMCTTIISATADGNLEVTSTYPKPDKGAESRAPGDVHPVLQGAGPDRRRDPHPAPDRQMHGRCCLGESCLCWGSDQPCGRVWGCLKPLHPTEPPALPQPFPRSLLSSHLLGIPHPALWGAHPPSVGLAKPMSPCVSPGLPQLSHAHPPSFPGGPTSCCQPEPQQHQAGDHPAPSNPQCSPSTAAAFAPWLHNPHLYPCPD
uniref:Prostaglandin-H2 D-isomerase n=1 Tax=Corvus moneduloides TaxID=1196302 RepID=A0A8C3GS42_CORMO